MTGVSQFPASRPEALQEDIVPVLMERRRPGIGPLAKSPCKLYTDKQAFECALPPASVAVVFIEETELGFRDWFMRLSYCHPGTRLVCVALLDEAVARTVVQARPDDVLWWPEGAEEFARRVSRWRKSNPRGCLRRMREAAEHFEFATRVAIRRLCDIRRPAVTQVRMVAQEVVRACETTLRRDWQTDFGDVKPKAVMDWIVWLRAVCGVDPWETAERNKLRIAMRLGIHESTLDRLSKRLTGRTFAQSSVDPGLGESLKDFEAFWQRALECAPHAKRS